MILTVTANPSTDRTAELTETLRPGEVHRGSAFLDQPGGKGVNISRASVAAGVPTLAVLPALKEETLVPELLALGVDVRSIQALGPTRVNLTLTDPDGVTTKINSPGAEATAEFMEELAAKVLTYAGQASWVVLAGSLPPGAPAGWYADLAPRVRALGTPVAVDTSDAPLAALVEGLPGSAPSLMKPNGAELASLTGADPDALESDPAAAAVAAAELCVRGVDTVLATLGGHGAVLVTRDGAWHATPGPTTVLSTVGAGDSSLFGYVLADLRGEEPAERLRHAVAYGSAAAALPGTGVPRPHDVRPEAVSVVALPAPAQEA